MPRKKGFGTFGGVFVPNILTILGVIMYLRLGWVVGNAGLRNALIILLIANLITLFTAFSISAIATNMRMRAGGAYYMVSRSLGAEVGGSIGIPLYLAQALVISLYIVGFAESLTLLLPGLNQKLVTLVTLAVLSGIALASSNLVIRIQYVILGVIVLSLVSFFSGSPVSMGELHLDPQYLEGYGFWEVFAVFFPAVTGILSGLSLSGDLKNPAKSIPTGTLLSVVAGAVVYLLIAFWFSMASDPKKLLEENLIMVVMARWGPLVYAGIWGATLSSALANIMAAPRTLQALSRDGIFLRFFQRGRGKSNEPVAATLFTFVLVAGVLMVGTLNTIAPVLTMFFLITYGSLNMIAFLEGLIRRPGFRPTFRVHWSVSLAGALGCVWVMFLINPLACVIGFVFVLVLYMVLKRIQIRRKWGDFRQGFWSMLIQFSLDHLEGGTEQAKSWRPMILLAGENLLSKQKMVRVAFELTRKTGFLSCINLYPENDNGDMVKDEQKFRSMLKENRIQAFYRGARVDRTPGGQAMASQIHGIGNFSHNTILLDWPDTISLKRRISRDTVEGFRQFRMYHEQQKSLLLLNADPSEGFEAYRTIDVWWDPGQKNGSFMLVLAHLLASGFMRGNATVRIKTVVMKDRMQRTRVLLENLVRQSRIKAEVRVIHPDSEKETRFGVRYDRSEFYRRKRRDWFEKAGVFFRNDGQDEKEMKNDLGKQAMEGKGGSPQEKDGHEDLEVKDMLSEQVRDRDGFIIDRSIHDIIANNSGGADLVMLGFNLPAEGREKRFIERMDELLAQLPDTLLVNCPFDFDLSE